MFDNHSFDTYVFIGSSSGIWNEGYGESGSRATVPVVLEVLISDL